MESTCLYNNKHHSGVAPGTRGQAPCWRMDWFQVDLAKTVPIGHEHTHKQAHEYTGRTHPLHFQLNVFVFFNGNCMCTQTHLTGINYLN